MNQHWVVQPLALVVLVFCVGVSQLDRIVTPDFCKNASSPQAIVKTAKLAGICLPVTTAQIPSILTSWGLHTLRPLTDKLPKPIEMVENRIEIGKISAGLAAIGTPESDLMMEAIEDYDSQAKETIQSLSKLSFMSTLVHKSLVGSLTGIINSLEGFPRGEKRARVLQAMIRSRQDAINTWVTGLTEALKVFHDQTTATLANLDGCDASLKQIIRTSGRTKGQQQGNVDPTVQDWGSMLYGVESEHVQPAALGAVPRLEALIRESSIAREKPPIDTQTRCRPSK
ncbi:hypothetical protein GALMADRAFT_573970 [Galerina marginata CBS 339.88]|uniref:Uncharacterized protein n=1 Tax=Galerina marginata (strain CBS 339.88) TaxID=685588 RepID=A0A067SW18_GALM3|nr:hypothetical protein GALMADRAFT_573970 [Galerina marginata CBS 339.88]